jgi:germination protein M
MRYRRLAAISLVLIILITLILAGCTKKQQPNPVPEKPQAEPATTEITVYYDASTDTEYCIAPEKREVAEGDLPLKAMQELIKGPSEGSGLKPILPKDTKVLSVEVKEKIAYPNFEKDFPSKLNVGSGYESLVVAAIVNTLTELEGVDQVQILVDGKIVESLAGHVVIDTPLKREEQLIKK